jgi:uncharacterized PurR-regulated membrane protein YhhQ (DUF165 family)
VNDALSAAITLYAVVLALAGVAVAVLRPGRSPGIATGLAALGVVSALRSVIDVAELLGGRRPAEPVVHLAYVLTALALAPAAFAVTRRDATRWATAVHACAAFVTAVVTIRLTATGRPGA